jgi:hypothetical protein
VTTRLDGSAVTIPTRPLAIEGSDQSVLVPDWEQLSFGTLPGVLSDGSFVAPRSAIAALGYDPSRAWQAGQTPDEYMMLGDFEDSLALHQLSLGEIGQIVGADLSQVALSEFGLAGRQSISDLVEAIPELGNERIAAVAPIRDLIEQQAPETLARASRGVNDAIGEWVVDNPDIAAALDLDNLPLEEYGIGELPGILEVDLGAFEQWRETFLQEIPKLNEVPFSAFPEPLQAAGAVGTVDIAFGPAESDRRQTVSGSNQAGFSVPCETNCAHAELAGSPALKGKQWISGKYQAVDGGEGVLGEVFSGREPTGRHPFGDAFKVVIWDVDETKGQIDTALFFRICKRGLPDLGCTPYGIGPVPFLSHREKGLIFLGLLDQEGGISTSKSYPQAVEELSKTLGLPSEAQLPQLTLNRYGFFGGGGLCGTGPGGVDFNALASAFSSIEGNYDSLGSYACDDAGNCGRGLGRYQYMSYRRDVRQVIQSQAGGAGLLRRLDGGGRISRAELMKYFGESQQNQIFKADVTNNIEGAMAEIDPRTGDRFSGRRLIERVGQRHFGGFGAAIDGGSSDRHGRLSLLTYGQELAEEYFRQLENQGEVTCGVATGQFINPAKGYRITSGFGYRRRPCNGCSSYHAALDFGTPMNTPIAAADGGQVIFAGWAKGWGNTVVIDHGNGYQTRYSHLNSFGVGVGDAVAQGQTVARSGMTGWGTGPHLDFAVYRGNWQERGTAIDPRQVIQF